MNSAEFIHAIAPMVVVDMMESGVLASITIAQAILESDSGNRAPGNNLFGIKGNGQQHITREFIDGRWVTVEDEFRVYQSWQESITDHSNFLHEHERYTKAGFFAACRELDYNKAAQALQAAGYATAPNYARQLIGIIEQYTLDQYDREAVNHLREIEDLKASLAKLQEQTAVLQKTSPPDWFIKEFGEHALDGIVNDMTGDVDFWRSTAVSLRLLAAAKKQY